MSDNATDFTEVLLAIDFHEFIQRMLGLDNVEVFEIDGFATNHQNQFLKHLSKFLKLKQLKIAYFDNKR